MEPILILVGEDHQPATHAISRRGWFDVVREFVGTSDPKIVCMIEESQGKADLLMNPTNPQYSQYSRVIGFEETNPFVVANRELLLRLLREGHLHDEDANACKRTLMTNLQARDFGEVPEKIIKMDIEDWNVFFGQNTMALETLSKSAERRMQLIERFCKDMGFAGEEHERYQQVFQESLLKWSSQPFSQQLFLVQSYVANQTELRLRENPIWANTIRAVGLDADIDAVIVFAGNGHIKDVGPYLGLETLLNQNMGSYRDVYVTSNLLSDFPKPPSPPTSDDSESVSSGDDDNVANDERRLERERRAQQKLEQERLALQRQEVERAEMVVDRLRDQQNRFHPGVNIR